MKPIFLALALTVISPFSLAQETFKCKVNGSMVYQDRPCPGAGRYSENLPPKTTPQTAVQPVAQTTAQATPSQGNNAAPLSDLERQKTFLAKGAKDRKISDLKYQIEHTEAGIANSHAAMQNELANLDARRRIANNNLAGATYLESIATEKNSVTSRYESEITTLRDRLKMLRDDLAKAQKEG